MSVQATEHLWRQIATTQYGKVDDAHARLLLLNVRIGTPPPAWTREVETAAGTLHLRAANSTTELRHNLAEYHRMNGEGGATTGENTESGGAGMVVFVCNELARTVPADVLARAYGGHVRAAGREDALVASFNATAIAADLRRNADLMEAVLSEGLTGTANGELTERFALRALWRAMIRGQRIDGTYDNAAFSPRTLLLEYALQAHATLHRLPESLRARLEQIAIEDVGPVARLFFVWARVATPRCAFLPLLLATEACHQALASGAIPEPRWISLGGHLWPAGAPAATELASTRQALDEWASQVPPQRNSAAQAAEHEARADLALANAGDLMSYSSITQDGWNGRLTRLNLALLQALSSVPHTGTGEPLQATTAIAAAHQAITHLGQHHYAQSLDTNQEPAAHQSADARRTLARARDMLALVQALAAHSDTTAGASATVETDHARALTALSTFQMHDGRFVDAVRERVERHTLPEQLGQARAAIVAASRRAVNARNRRFAEAYAALAPDDALPPIIVKQEMVIEEVVAPLLRQDHRLLWIVMDGMSWSVTQNLISDIAHTTNGECLVPARDGNARPMLAMVPTITALARTSLLTGQRAWGDQNTERKGLPTNWHLQNAHRTTPVIFHRADVGEAGTDMDSISTAIQSTVALVTVVVNAVDESLSGSAQQIWDWTLASLPALKRLLEQARQAGRSVLLAADHGSVWATSASSDTDDACVTLRDRRLDDALDAVTRATPSGLADTGKPVRHSRFERAADGTMTMATSDAFFFKSIGTAGTHGGLTMQEAVAPLLLVADAGKVDGAAWTALDQTEPAWMRAPSAEPAAAPLVTGPAEEVFPEPTKPARKGRTTVTEAPAPQASLPGLAPPPAATTKTGLDVAVPTGWGAALLENPAFMARTQGRIRSKRDRRYLFTLLAVLEANGYRCSLAQVAGPLGCDELSVRNFVSMATQIFNVDGCTVLSMEPSTGIVMVDAALLGRQFGG